MFEKDAEEYADRTRIVDENTRVGDDCISLVQDYEGNIIDIHERIKQAFLAGLKAGRPQWHYVKDGDLPKDTTSLYLVRVYSWNFSFSHLYKKYTTYIPTVCEWSGEYFKALDDMAYYNARNIKSCIAWCEIPTFDKE